MTYEVLYWFVLKNYDIYYHNDEERFCCFTYSYRDYRVKEEDGILYLSRVVNGLNEHYVLLNACNRAAILESIIKWKQTYEGKEEEHASENL
jgi:hypothetical protein